MGYAKEELYGFNGLPTFDDIAAHERNQKKFHGTLLLASNKQSSHPKIVDKRIDVVRNLFVEKSLQLDLYSNNANLVDPAYAGMLMKFIDKYKKIQIDSKETLFFYNAKDHKNNDIHKFNSKSNLKHVEPGVIMLCSKKCLHNNVINYDIPTSIVDFVWLNLKTPPLQGICFDVEGKADESKFLNLWRGFQITPKEISDTSEIQIFLDYLLKALCSNNKSMYSYLVNYLAHMVQFPEQIPRVAVVMPGLQGVGKNSLIAVLQRFFSYENFFAIANTSQITGKFNKQLEAKLMVFANEAVFSFDKSGSGVLKSMITDSTITIEEKGKTPYMVDNYMRLFIATNFEDQSCWIEDNDRRYFVLDTSPVFMGDTEFWDDYYSQISNNQLAEKVFYFLKEMVDLSEFDILKYPKGRAYGRIKSAMNPLLQFIDSIARCQVDGINFMTYRQYSVKANVLYGKYKEFIQLIDIKDHVSITSFGRSLAEFGLPKKRTNSGYEYNLDIYLLADILANKTCDEKYAEEILEECGLTPLSQRTESLHPTSVTHAVQSYSTPNALNTASTGSE